MNLFNALMGAQTKALPPAVHQKSTQPDYSSMIGRVAGLPVTREVNGTIVPYADNRETYVRSGYNYNDIIYMVVKLIVDKACVPNWAPYDVVDETALKEYQRRRDAMSGIAGKPPTPKEWIELKNLQYKALKPVKDERLQTLLDAPNPQNSLNKHHALLFTSKLVLGGYTEQWFVPSGGLAQGFPTSLEWLPYQYMNLYTNRQHPLRITGYELNAWNLPKFTPEEILHEAYANLDWSEDGRHFYGLSPIKAALRRLQRNNESQTSGVRAFQNGGVRGIAYLDIPAEVLKEDFQGDFTADQSNTLKARYDAITSGGSARAGATTFSGYKVGFAPIGLSPVDLDQMAFEKWDMRMIAAIYGAPSQLFNDPDNKTFANEAEGNKALILRSCLPILNDRELSFNQQLRTLAPYKRSNRIVTYDIKQYTELEENKKDTVAWMKQADWMTPNEKRDGMGLPLRPEEEMNKIYLPSGYTPIEDLSAPTEPEGTDPNDDDVLDDAGANDFNQDDENNDNNE